jgi:lipoic acid synthetase
MKVEEYVSPAKFDMWKERALEMGFLYCASGPLVRSSYKAGEAFIENVLRGRATERSRLEDGVPVEGRERRERRERMVLE